MAMMDNISNEWASVISGIVNKPATNSIWSIIQRLVLGATVYYLWQERNIRRVNHMFRSQDVVLKCIVDTIRLKLMGLSLKRTADVEKATSIWGFVDYQDDPHKTLKNKGIVDSRCSRHMTGNKAYLAEYQD
ncbi:hypothetical protein Tco_0991995 [Tanacetum coccineum]|uniref:Phytosulfokine n=1 Tax=Tanacetum coccineum TaxID=301880 RepID=A0ABQ5F0T7_9ASTR